MKRQGKLTTDGHGLARIREMGERDHDHDHDHDQDFGTSIEHRASRKRVQSSERGVQREENGGRTFPVCVR